MFSFLSDAQWDSIPQMQRAGPLLIIDCPPMVSERAAELVKKYTVAMSVMGLSFAALAMVTMQTADTMSTLSRVIEAIHPAAEFPPNRDHRQAWPDAPIPERLRRRAERTRWKQ